MKTSQITAFAAALSLLPMGQPMLLGTLTASTEAIVPSVSKSKAKDASEIAQIAKAITVRIEGSIQGSGVLVKKEDNRYTVLTALHVIQDNLPGEEVGIITSDGKEHLWESKSLKRLGEVDMAVLTFKSKNSYQIANIGDIKSVNSGHPIFVSGFPLPTLSVNQSIWRFLDGKVVANANIAITDGYQLLYSNPTLPGMSGGSVLNKEGELVGIHGRSERDARTTDKTGKIIATGINQAVPINYYSQFIKGEKVEFKTIKPATIDDYLAKIQSIHRTKRDYLDNSTRRKDMINIINLSNKSLEIKKTSDAYFERGFAKDIIEDYKGAYQDFTKAINLEDDPKKLIKFYMSRSTSIIMRDYYKTHTKKEIENGIEKKDLLINTYNESLKDDNKAIQNAEKLKDKKLLAGLYRLRSLTYQSLNRHQESINDCKKIIDLFPKKAEGYNCLGEKKLILKDYKGSIQEYSKAIELEPNLLSYRNRAGLKNKLNDYNGAINDYSEAIRLSKEKTYDLEKRALIKEKIGDIKGAISDTDRIIEITPKNTSMYLYRANLKINNKDFYGAIFDSLKALEIDDNEHYAYIVLSNAKRGLGDQEGAVDDLNKLFFILKEERKSDPNSQDIIGKIAWVKYFLQDYNGAIEESNKVLSKVSNLEWALHTRGMSKYKLGKEKDGCIDLKKAASLGDKETRKYLANKEGAWCKNMPD